MWSVKHNDKNCYQIWVTLYTVDAQLMLNIGLIRMNILMLDTRNVEQTKDVRMYIEEFILVDIWIHCCTKLN